MKRYLYPDYDFESFEKVTPDFLRSIDVEYLICDIDNTLVPYDTSEPTPKVIKWLDELKKNGIKIVFVSNNEKERVEKFNFKLRLPALFKAGKPLRSSADKAIKLLDGDRKKTAVLGDQLLTDVLTARFSSLKSIYVPSIKKVDTLFFKFKRMIERPIIRSYYKRKNNV